MHSLQLKQCDPNGVQFNSDTSAFGLDFGLDHLALFNISGIKTLVECDPQTVLRFAAYHAVKTVHDRRVWHIYT